MYLHAVIKMNSDYAYGKRKAYETHQIHRIYTHVQWKRPTYKIDYSQNFL